MNSDDFEQFITLLDAALASDDPNIKKALKKFMFLVRLNISDDEMEEGPFTKMMETIDSLQRRVSELEHPKQNYTNVEDWTYTDATTTPQWIYSGGTSTSGTITIPGSSTTNVTLQGGSNTTLGGSSCTGFTTTGTSYIINSDNSAPKGTEIKESIQDKLEALLA